MFFKNKNDKEVEARDRIIQYKKVFSSQDGKEVLFDLMNKNFILYSHKGDAFSEGRRAAVLDILSMCNINLSEFDRLLKGETYDSVNG